MTDHQKFPPMEQWLDNHGIDRAYKKDMKGTYLKEKKEAEQPMYRQPMYKIFPLRDSDKDSRLK